MNRRIVARAIATASAGVAALAFAAPALAEQENTNIHVVQLCTSAGQKCNAQQFTPFTTTGGDVNFEFTADPGHCSDIVVRFIVDGSSLGETQLSPGERSGAFITPLKAGQHAVRLSATGVQGGCNVGKLGSWEGDLLIQRLA